LQQAGLPQPQTNYAIGPYFADFAWPTYRLVVEFDGFATHGHRQAFTPDRKRGADLTARAGALAVREAA
jgi:very-short-patch-repair endonuclease